MRALNTTQEADETVRQHSRNAIVSLSHTFPNAILTFLQGIDPRVSEVDQDP